MVCNDEGWEGRSGFGAALLIFPGGALLAVSEEDQFVSGELEPFWEQWSDVSRAAVDLENAKALIAAEVMVMRFPGDLVAGWLTRNLNGDETVLLYQRFEVSVDGRDA